MAAPSALQAEHHVEVLVQDRQGFCAKGETWPSRASASWRNSELSPFMALVTNSLRASANTVPATAKPLIKNMRDRGELALIR